MAGLAQDEYAFDKAPIRYSDTQARDAVARLETLVASGGLALDGEPRHQVRQILRALDVPEPSQVLVFSKTSVQEDTDQSKESAGDLFF